MAEYKSQRVDKPWGHELIWAHTDRYVGKILHINKSESLSLQYHEKKDETIHVLNGEMNFHVGEDQEALEVILMKPGDSYHITTGLIHKMEAIEDCDILEASTPELEDVVRLKDNYGRV
jgi:mannose-6-phosphate isomerase